MVLVSKNAINNSALLCGYFQNDSLVVKIMAYKLDSRYTVQSEAWGPTQLPYPLWNKNAFLRVNVTEV